MWLMEIKPVKISPPPIIPTIDPPVTRRAERSVIPEIDMPIINMPDTTIKYPVIDVPTQEEFDAAVRAEQKKQEEEKCRGQGPCRMKELKRTTSGP